MQTLRKMKKIIVPVDFTDLSKSALHFAIQYAKVIDSEIEILHVMELPTAHYSFSGEVQSESMSSFYTQAYIKGVKQRLDEWVNENQTDVVVSSLMMWW